ncbi:BnaC02g38320D [Brassica napus]|uniref:40S ribosomal protein S27 n=1 Tax=Brassica napus TaxID=3708 RepID=A0A078HD53_BRANA|nr:BnaC02g38320D [Brassica napus]
MFAELVFVILETTIRTRTSNGLGLSSPTDFSCILRLGFSPARLRRIFLNATMVLQNDIDLLNPPAELEKRKHKLKRLVQSPNSFFMDVKCQGCFNITTVFSHSQTVVVCGNCQTVLCQPTGGKARLTEGCSFRKK